MDDNKRDLYESLWWVRQEGPIGGLMTFNADYGYIESIVRGFRSGFLKSYEYRQLCQCESLDDVKLTMGDTDYLNVLSNVNKLTPEIILKRCEDKFVAEFNFLQSQATGPLSTFLDFITYEDLITNISFIITSMIKGADPTTLLHKSLPLGKSPHLRSVMTFENFEGSDGLVELYRTVLIDTPVAHYFENYFNSEIKSDSPSREIQRVYNEVEIDIITNMLQKLWLEDFYAYCQRLGGETAVIMKTLLEFEADRRAISIMINSFNTNLNDPQNRDSERKKLFCSFGQLYPEATLIRFSQVGDINQLAVALEPYKVYSDLYRQSAEGGGKSLEDLLYEEEVKLCRYCFDGQSHFASFYGWVKLKKQEMRNIKWSSSRIPVAPRLHSPLYCEAESVCSAAPALTAFHCTSSAPCAVMTGS